MTKVAGLGELTWNVVRAAGEDVVAGDLRIEDGELRFRPGNGNASAPADWSFSSALAEIADIETVERTLQNFPMSLERGIRVRAIDGSQASFYVVGRARDRADVVVAGIRELVKSARGPGDAETPQPATYTDRAEDAPLGGSASAMRNLRRYNWLFGFLAVIVFTPELVAALREDSGEPSFARAWVLVHPGNFIAFGLHLLAGRFITSRNHPLLAVLPISLYFVGTSILAIVLYAFYVVPTGAVLAPLVFGIPAAIFMVVTLAPRHRRAWREARDNDKAAAAV